MKFDIKQYLDNNSIRSWTKGNNCQDGWVNINCPMCDDPSNHGGFNLSDHYYNCWRCGAHDIVQVLREITGKSRSQIEEELKGYSKNYYQKFKPSKDKNKVAPENSVLELPDGTGPLSEAHKKYLRKRNFDPVEIEQFWSAQGTTHYGDYKFRIIIPIFIDNAIVSYQGRDYTNKSDLRYKTCKIEDELIHHKYILYGADHIPQSRVAIICEGPLDVWRLGPGACATFGSTWTPEQLSFTRKRADKIFVMFDPEEEAQEKAEKFAWAFCGLGGKAEILMSDSGVDPGDMEDDEIIELRRDIFKERS